MYLPHLVIFIKLSIIIVDDVRKHEIKGGNSGGEWWRQLGSDDGIRTPRYFQQMDA